MRFSPTVLRSLIFGCILHLGIAASHAQQQESRINKILKPDTNVSYNFQSKEMKRNGVDTGSARVKDFYFPKKFNAKDFLTGNYGGGKNFWMGDFKYATTTVEIGSRRVIPNAEKHYDSKSVGVKSAYDSGKSHAVAGFSGKPYAGRGTAQDKFDAQGADALTGSTPVGWQGALGQMSIDQVRDLLNKNK